MFLLHLWIIWNYTIIVRKCKSNGKWARASKWIITKSFNFLTFSYYIRTILEMNQYLLVSSIYEVNQFNTDGIYRIVSTIYSMLVLGMCLALIGCVGWLFTSSYQILSENHSMLGEFFEGMKPNKKSKLYSLLLILRRTLFVTVLICFSSLQNIFQIGILWIFEIIYFIIICYIRPYCNIKSNIIEILNELWF